MANILNTEKQATIIGLRVTGVHRDTIMRLGVRVGKGCQTLLDRKIQNRQRSTHGRIARMIKSAR